MLVKCKDTNRLEIGNTDIGIRRKNLHMFHKKKTKWIDWETAEKKKYYVMQCWKCKRTTITNDSLKQQRTPRECSHEWDSYFIYEAFDLYKFEVRNG